MCSCSPGPRRCAPSGNDKSDGVGGDVNRDSSVRAAGARSPPAHLLIPACHAPAAPSAPPLSRGARTPERASPNLPAILCNVFGPHPPSPSLGPAPSLSRPLYLLRVGLGQAAGGAVKGWPAAVWGSRGARLQGSGVRQAAPAADLRQPRPPRARLHPLSLLRPAACSVAVPSLCNRVLLPGCTLGF